MEPRWQKQGYLFLASQNISLFGTMVTGYAITWYISLKTGSGLWLALATVCYLLPQILISLVGGAWADKYSRKWLIMGADGSIALLTLILAIIWGTGHQSIWLLLGFSVLRSIGQGIQQPAVSSAYPQLVPEDELTRINGINQTVMSLATLLSPVLGGIILANFNLVWALMVDVFTAIIELACMTKIKLKAVRQTVEAVEESIKQNEQDLLSGIKYLYQNTKLRQLFILAGIGFLMMTPATVLSLLFVQREFGASVTNLTLQEIFWAGGSVLSGLMVAKHKEFKNNAKVLGMAIAAFAFIMMLMGFSPVIGIYFAAMFALGVCSPYYMTT